MNPISRPTDHARIGAHFTSQEEIEDRILSLLAPDPSCLPEFSQVIVGHLSTEEETLQVAEYLLGAGMRDHEVEEWIDARWPGLDYLGLDDLAGGWEELKSIAREKGCDDLLRKAARLDERAAKNRAENEELLGRLTAADRVAIEKALGEAVAEFHGRSHSRNLAEIHTMSRAEIEEARAKLKRKRAEIEAKAKALADIDKHIPIEKAEVSPRLTRQLKSGSPLGLPAWRVAARAPAR